jgi:hypothetical protein
MNARSDFEFEAHAPLGALPRVDRDLTVFEADGAFRAFGFGWWPGRCGRGKGE